jgi:hypothetical protein
MTSSSQKAATPAEADPADVPPAHDIFLMCKKPLRLPDLAADRTARVQLLAEAAIALLDGRLPDSAARVYLAGGLLAWLNCGGSLTKKYWATAAPQGSNATECELWQKIREKNASASGSATEEEKINKIDHHQI